MTINIITNLFTLCFGYIYWTGMCSVLYMIQVDLLNVCFLFISTTPKSHELLSLSVNFSHFNPL